MKRIHFFATPGDAPLLLSQFEADGPLQFVEAGNYDHPGFARYCRAEDIPEPGVATHESAIVSRSYLVLDGAELLVCPRFRGAGSEWRWSPSNGENGGSVQMTLAGAWKDMLLAGLVATLHSTPSAQGLMKRFAKALRRADFTKMGTYWLGPEALSELRAGKRLSTTAEQSPPQYDLIPPIT